jgi:regulator of RNase E activity RraA
VTPSSTVGRYITVDRDVPVTCGGVRVHPGDLIVGDTDGIVVVPLVNAGEVLRVATEIEETEQRMVEAIRRTGSILRALDEFARI